MIIKKGLKSFLEVGTALLEIKNYKEGLFYKDGYGTFENYCREKWRFGQSYAYRLIGAAEVVTEISPIGENEKFTRPTSESQIRPLSRLANAEDRKTAWEQAASKAGKNEITAKIVSDVVRDLIKGGASARNKIKQPNKKKNQGKNLAAKEIKSIKEALERIKEAVTDNADVIALVEEIENLIF